MFFDSRINFPLRKTETIVSRPSKTRATRGEEVEGEGKDVLYVQFASFTLNQKC